MRKSMFRHVLGFALLAIPAAAVLSMKPAHSACPRPHDKDGRPLYGTLTGKLVSSGSRRGGHFVTVKPEYAAAPFSVSITDEMYAVIQSLSPETSITLVAYYRSAISGARPPYTCIEVVREQEKKKG
jgi:hypothetical protein